MPRINLTILGLAVMSCLILATLCLADGDHHHKKVIIHVPLKVHTIHHHTVKKVPVYHYYKHHDHHHHHHHIVQKHEHEEHHDFGDWDR